MSRTLVLDIGFQPHRIVSWQRAVLMLFQSKCEIVEEYDEIIYDSDTFVMKMPAVIRLLNKVGRKKAVRFSRMNVLTRDKWRCFVRGTRILMSDGQQKNIEDILPGDRVIDAFGRPQNVKAVGRSIADAVVVLKRRCSFEETLVTPDHEFLNRDGEFEPISTSETVVLPRSIQYELPSPGVVDVGSLLPDEWMRYKSGRVFWSRRPHEPGFPAFIEHSKELAYFLGLYCAEGCSGLRQGLVELAFHIDERDTLAKDAADFLSKLGVNPKIVETPEKKSCRVRVSSKTLSYVLDELCGNGAYNKKTPWVAIGPYHEEYLRGLFLGDACIYKNQPKVVLTMCANNVIHGAMSMLWGLGIYPTLQTINRDGRATAWSLVLNARNNSKFLSQVIGESAPVGRQIHGTNSHVVYSVQSTEPAGLDVEVFNLEVEDAHSYIANGMAVHNCQYCGKRFKTRKLNYDHVVPRAKGGKTVWENIVTSCYPCNAKKGGKTPEQAGMRLLNQPYKPKSLPVVSFHIEETDSIPDIWRNWCYWHGKLESDGE